MGDDFTLEDALIIIRRRVMLFALPALATLVVGLAVVMLLPAKYTAQGVIAVDSAQIPTEMVRSTINALAQERIAMIRQRVMTRARLLEIADKYGLFPRRLGLSETQRVKRMRERLDVEPIIVEGSRQQAQRDGTIAFTLSYTDRSADKAHEVANEFMSLFLSEDVRTRTTGASNTTEFFRAETGRLSSAVDAVEKRIAEYKAQNSDALPEHEKSRLDALERLKRDIVTSESQLAALDEEQRFLETQLASYVSGAGGDDGPAAELARLRAELVQLRSVYRDAHPSVQAVRDQISSLQASLAPSKDIQDLQRTLAAVESELKNAQKTLPAGDPAIAEKRKAVADAQQKLSELITRQASSGSQDFMSAQLMGRISLANSRRSSLQEHAETTLKQVGDLESRISRAPEVERGLAALTRNRENLFNEYQDVLAKQQAAQLAENLEDDQKAEKFSILEPAARPEKPSSPERLKLAVLAFFGALAAGAMTALAAEFLQPTVRGRNHLEALIQTPPIAIIPNFPREGERRWNFRLPGRRPQPAAPAAAA